MEDWQTSTIDRVERSSLSLRLSSFHRTLTCFVWPILLSFIPVQATTTFHDLTTPDDLHGHAAPTHHPSYLHFHHSSICINLSVTLRRIILVSCILTASSIDAWSTLYFQYHYKTIDTKVSRQTSWCRVFCSRTVENCTVKCM